MLRFLASNKAITILFAVAGVGIMISGYTSSLWFLRNIWGPSAGDVEFGYQNTPAIATFFLGEGKKLEEKAHQTLGFNQKKFRRIAYIQDESGEYITAIPRLDDQLTAGAELKAAGWDVHRVGWVVLASRTISKSSKDVRTYSLWNGAIGEARAICNKLPLSPLFFFRSSAKKDSDLALYASDRERVIHLSASIGSSDFVAVKKTSNIRKDISASHDIIVALPSAIVRSMGKDFLDSIEGFIAHLFHFQKTMPRIISTFPAGERMYMIMDKTQVALGVQKQGDVFEDRMIAAMNKEQGQRHPKKKAFALPDRSLGYEYIRGVTNVGFASQKSTSVCLPSRAYDEALFLCERNQAAVLASSDRIGKELLDFMDTLQGDWEGYLSGEYPMYFIGTDKNIEFWISEYKK